ncbi:DUF6514 family protein [Lawsonibacter sp. LCP25S3_F5]
MQTKRLVFQVHNCCICQIHRQLLHFHQQHSQQPSLWYSKSSKAKPTRKGATCMIEYRSVPEQCFDPDLGNYSAYGICACQVEQNRTTEILAIHDVFLNAADALSFVRRCNWLELSPVSLWDVIQDTLGV